MGLPYLLQRKVGIQQAALLLLAQEPVSGREAERIGLVTRCVPAGTARGEAMRLARRIAGAAPAVIGELTGNLRLSRKKLMLELEVGARRQAKDFLTREYRTRVVRHVNSRVS